MDRQERTIFIYLAIFFIVPVFLFLIIDNENDKLRKENNKLKLELRISEGQKDTIIQQFDRCLEWK